MDYDNEVALVTALQRIASRMENIEAAILRNTEAIHDTLRSIQVTIANQG